MNGLNLGSDILAPSPVLSTKSQDSGKALSSENKSEFSDLLGLDTGNSLASPPLESTSDTDLPVLEGDISYALPEMSHQVAMLTFMSQMKSEFNIEPEKVVEAFLKLSPEQLDRPAVENVESIVAQLGIPVEAQSHACDELKAMLKVTEEESTQDKRILPWTATQDSLIAQMNMAQMVTPAPKSAVPSLMKVQTADEKLPLKSEKDSKLGAATLLAGTVGVVSHAATGMENTGSSSFKLAETTKEVSQPVSDVSTSSTKTEDLISDSSQKIAIPKELQTKPEFVESMPTLPMTEAFPSSPVVKAGARSAVPVSSSAATVTAGAAGGAAALGKMFLSDDSSEDSEQDSSPDLANQPYMTDSAALGSGAKGAEASFKTDPQGPALPQDNNLNEVIGQARFLAKKGGGEMKVQLRPEGLGEVSLSVKVQDGQVSVQMITQSGDAKKMLEHGLSELKTSLQSHQLDLSAVKVDVARDPSSHMDHHREQGSRQFAQGMLEDFRGQQGHQRAFAQPEMAVRRSYGSSSRESTPSGYMPMSRGSQNASRRLDLVA